MKTYRTWFVLVIALMMLSLSLCAVFVLGQGGTGREKPNIGSKNPPAPKRTPSSRKPRPPRRAPASANNTGKQTNDEPKADDAVANERTYWETIRLSSDPEDFKAYLKKYPNGEFADLAGISLRRLETQPKPRDKTNTSSTPPDSRSAKPAPKPGSIVRNKLGMELVYVPAGSFMMGSNNGIADEKPVHQVTIKEGFYMGRYEVTQAEWQQLMGSNPSNFKGDKLPVEQVSWDDAESFIRNLNARGDGFFYRLPTEAEWEYACRAGTTGDYAGDLNEMAWYSANSGGKTHAVGGKRPNAWGLADMHGNVWEWCTDYHHVTYDGAPTDGSAWVTGGGMRYRVSRGGSWGSGPPVVRSARRGNPVPVRRYTDTGFRVVAIPPIVLRSISGLAWHRLGGVR